MSVNSDADQTDAATMDKMTARMNLLIKTNSFYLVQML